MSFNKCLGIDEAWGYQEVEKKKKGYFLWSNNIMFRSKTIDWKLNRHGQSKQIFVDKLKTNFGLA